jgi:hypothetical protein
MFVAAWSTVPRHVFHSLPRKPVDCDTDSPAARLITDGYGWCHTRPPDANSKIQKRAQWFSRPNGVWASSAILRPESEGIVWPKMPEA